jgi:hemerythrin-like domain-containing protein
MATILDALDRDHRNLTAVLDVLQHQLDVLRRGGDPDYALMESVLDYCKSYGNVWHHPAEDRVYEQLERQPGALGELSRSLHDDHAALGRVTADFHEALEDVLGDGMMRKEKLLELGDHFLSDYRNHLRLEERFLFPAAKKHLSDEQLAAAEAQCERISDPLFGDEAETRFETLREHLQAMDRASTPPQTR